MTPAIPCQFPACEDGSYPCAKHKIPTPIEPVPHTEGRKVSEAGALTADKVIQALGDAATDVFEQMDKGNWADDHDHPVRNNTAMVALCDAVKLAMEFRAAPEGTSPKAPTAIVSALGKFALEYCQDSDCMNEDRHYHSKYCKSLQAICGDVADMAAQVSTLTDALTKAREALEACRDYFQANYPTLTDGAQNHVFAQVREALESPALVAMIQSKGAQA